MRVLKAHPKIVDTVRTHSLTNDEMRGILDDVLTQLVKPSPDDLPPDDDPGDED